MSVRFQWAKCQLDALRNCFSVSDVRKALRSLPKDLDDTYARILESIDNKGYGDQVAKILQWLAYSIVPMSLDEVAEMLTVDMESHPLVDFERRFEDPQDILELCSSLVSIGPGTRFGETSLQFAHFSVREVLESPRLDHGPAKKFALDEMRANILIAESCIAYNIHLDSLQVSFRRGIMYRECPLSSYAAEHWDWHAKNARENGTITSLCERLFRSRSDDSKLPSWLAIRSYDLKYLLDAQGRFLPLHCAIILHLPRIMRKLILEGADVNSKSFIGDAPGDLIAPDDHERVEDLKLLLDHGAKVTDWNDMQEPHSCSRCEKAWTLYTYP